MRRSEIAVTLHRQWHVLVALTQQPRTIVDLARDFQVSKATAQRDVDTLAKVFEVETVNDAYHKQRRLYSARIVARGTYEPPAGKASISVSSDAYAWMKAAAEARWMSLRQLVEEAVK